MSLCCEAFRQGYPHPYPISYRSIQTSQSNFVSEYLVLLCLLNTKQVVEYEGGNICCVSNQIADD